MIKKLIILIFYIENYYIIIIKMDDLQENSSEF